MEKTKIVIDAAIIVKGKPYSLKVKKAEARIRKLLRSLDYVHKSVTNTTQADYSDGSDY